MKICSNFKKLMNALLLALAVSGALAALLDIQTALASVSWNF